MNGWEFLDKQFARIERQVNRISVSGIAGMGIFILAGAVLYMVKIAPELGNNDLFKTLAQAIIVQGLIGLAMAAWFTKNSNRVEIDQPPERPVPIENVEEREN